jgi:hypothetical protein
MHAFLAFSTGARVRASCISLVHDDFITGCIVLDPLEMHFWYFWSMGELIIV